MVPALKYCVVTMLVGRLSTLSQDAWKQLCVLGNPGALWAFPQIVPKCQTGRLNLTSDVSSHPSRLQVSFVLLPELTAGSAPFPNSRVIWPVPEQATDCTWQELCWALPCIPTGGRALRLQVSP